MLVGITHAVQVHMARYRGRVGHVERNNRKNHAVLVGNPTACTTSCKRRFEYPKQNRVFSSLFLSLFISLGLFFVLLLLLLLCVFYFGHTEGTKNDLPLCKIIFVQVFVLYDVVSVVELSLDLTCLMLIGRRTHLQI